MQLYDVVEFNQDGLRGTGIVVMLPGSYGSSHLIALDGAKGGSSQPRDCQEAILIAAELLGIGFSSVNTWWVYSENMDKVALPLTTIITRELLTNRAEKGLRNV